jgi:predicted enzyme involved in methoxymalonyl-ACP biosynthesis
MLNSLINKLRQKKIKYLIAEYIPTKKNFIVKNFLSDQGLKKINEKNTLIPKYINDLDAGIDNYFFCETEKIIIKNLEVFKNVKK